MILSSVTNGEDFRMELFCFVARGWKGVSERERDNLVTTGGGTAWRGVGKELGMLACVTRQPRQTGGLTD